MLVSFILLGKYLEVVAKGKTSDALSKLTELAPETAVLLTFDKDGSIISKLTKFHGYFCSNCKYLYQPLHDQNQNFVRSYLPKGFLIVYILHDK
jgi:hypothetical protein